MFPSLDVWEDRLARSPAGQMALDEALLLGARDPSLRLYRWAVPAATFGYAQRLADVRPRAGALALVRRWTGGGIVIHGGDLTLALAVPARFDFCRQKPVEIYHRIHSALLPALAEFFPGVRLAVPADCRIGPACFEAPAPDDILSGGVKICGGALRRGRHGILYQGSIALAGADCSASIAHAFSADIRINSQAAQIEKMALRLTAEKYATAAWNAMR